MAVSPASTKRELFDAGKRRIAKWCALNDVEMPEVRESGDPAQFGVCAYYRSGVIHILVKKCAAVGTAGRQWSYPGYIVDRTPYGVLAHELGHHVEQAHGATGGILAATWRVETGEDPITSYCPNDNEWFGEMFRLFVTNPDLLHMIRPRTFRRLRRRWPEIVERRAWDMVLMKASRQCAAARNKIAVVARKRK